MKSYFSIGLILLALLTATSCAKPKAPITLKNAFPAGEVLKTGWVLNEKYSSETVVESLKGKDAPEGLTGRFEAHYGPADGSIWLLAITRHSSTIEDAQEEYAKMRPMFTKATDAKDLGDEGFTTPSIGGGAQEIWFRYRNLIVALSGTGATGQEMAEYAKRYLEFLEKAP